MCSFYCLKQTCLSFKVYSFTHLFIHSNLFNRGNVLVIPPSFILYLEMHQCPPFTMDTHECTHIHTHNIYTQSSDSAPSLINRREVTIPYVFSFWNWSTQESISQTTDCFDKHFSYLFNSCVHPVLLFSVSSVLPFLNYKILESKNYAFSGP